MRFDSSVVSGRNRRFDFLMNFSLPSIGEIRFGQTVDGRSDHSAADIRAHGVRTDVGRRGENRSDRRSDT